MKRLLAHTNSIPPLAKKTPQQYSSFILRYWTPPHRWELLRRADPPVRPIGAGQKDSRVGQSRWLSSNTARMRDHLVHPNPEFSTSKPLPSTKPYSKYPNQSSILAPGQPTRPSPPPSRTRIPKKDKHIPKLHEGFRQPASPVF